MKPKQQISETVKMQVLRLADHGYGSRKIALINNISRSLVRRILSEASPAELKSEAGETTKLSKFQQIISEKVAQGLTTTRIFREIRELARIFHEKSSSW